MNLTRQVLSAFVEPQSTVHVGCQKFAGQQAIQCRVVSVVMKNLK